MFKHSGFSICIHVRCDVYNRECIKPFGFRSIFTILQLFFYVSKKKIDIPPLEKTFFDFFFSFFSTEYC